MGQRLRICFRVSALSALLVFGILSSVSGDCSRKPPFSVTRHLKSPGDNGFKIIINGDPERYIPGTLYTVTLVGSRTHNRLQQFSRFSLGAEPRDPQGDATPLTTGQFQLFADTMSTFDEDCINTVKEADDLPKTEVQVMWKAPKEGSGCVYIKGMVFENTRKWFQNDGQLTRLICEQTSREPAGERCCACDDAKYTMVFEGLWSNVTHPKDFPISLWLTHFSDVIGASHESGFTFWGEGQIASDGFRSLAEWGSVRLMEQELRQQSKHLKTIIKAAGLWYPKVNANTTASFKVDRKRHLISLASMFGPTPDWVVGVNGLNLCQKDCSWAPSLVLDLLPYDAGTDSGITYMSPNLETKPHEKMFRITTKYPEDPRAPFYDPSTEEMEPLARLHLIRESIIPRSCDDRLLQELTLEVAENTEDTARPECGVTEWSQWSPCSVSCGKGLRMRSREYTMPPQKVQMFGCNRQLVSKEMCVASVPECPGGGGLEDNQDELDSDIGAGGDGEGICATGEWGPWSDCSATCGAGFLMRSRHFLDRMGRKKCPLVNLVEKQKCMSDPCGEEPAPEPECPVTPWSEWSACSVSCGRGARVRVRLSLAEPDRRNYCAERIEMTQHAPCSDRPDCTLDMATAKQVCMQEADPGPCRGSYERWTFHPQKLMCVPFTYNGCKGNRNNFLTEEDCLNTCSVVRGNNLGAIGPSPPLSELAPRLDCMVTDWSDWSPCSVTCGIGYSERVRVIKLEAQNGGIPCPRRLNKRRRCYGPSCH